MPIHRNKEDYSLQKQSKSTHKWCHLEHLRHDEGAAPARQRGNTTGQSASVRWEDLHSENSHRFPHCGGGLRCLNRFQHRVLWLGFDVAVLFDCREHSDMICPSPSEQRADTTLDSA